MKRTALVTGSNRGIGRAIAEELARRGDIRVLAAARREDDAVNTAATIGQGAQGVLLDLTDPSSVAERAIQIESEYGPVDILINNAGVLFPGSALDSDLADISSSIAITQSHPSR